MYQLKVHPKVHPKGSPALPYHSDRTALPCPHRLDLAIFHDPHCAIHQGGLCDCDPDVRVMGESDPKTAN